MHKHSLLFIASLFLLQSVPALAADNSCAPRDFRSALGAIRNQKQLSWCYAVSAADLITQKTHRRVSAADLATTFLIQSPKDLSESRDPEIQKHFQENTSFYSDLKHQRKNEAINFDPKEIDGEKGLIDAGGDAALTILLANAKGSCLEKNLPADEKLILKMLKEAKREVLKSIDREPPLPQLDPTSPLINPISFAIAKRFEKMVDQRCKREPYSSALISSRLGELDIEAYAAKYKNDVSGRKALHDKLFTQMNTVLDEGKAVEIGYSLYSIAEKPDDQHERDGDHSGVIVGRKIIDGECRYLLRNTQGPECDFLPKLNKRCSKGHIWLSREELEPTFYGLSYIK